MSDAELNLVNKLKIMIARAILDLDDEKVMELIKEYLKEQEAENDE